MTLHNLISTNAWLSVSLTLEKHYPNDVELLPNYQEVFETLNSIDVKPSDFTIFIEQSFDDEDYEYNHVYGKKLNNPTDEDAYAIEYVPWNEWLGMDISEGVL